MIVRSLRARVTGAAVVVVVMVLAGTVVAATLLARRQLIADIDATLRQRADQVEAAIDTPTVAVASSASDDRFAQIIGANGVVAASTVGIPALVDPTTAHEGSSTRTDLPIEDDSYRVLVARIDDGTLIVVGQNTDDLDDSVKVFALTLSAVAPIVAAMLGGVIWLVVGRTLRPVDELRREVDAIGLAELDHRVPTSGRDDEVDRLAATMNTMLARLERAVDQQRRFVGDASHELRTPLTRLRAQLDTQSDVDAAALTRSVDQLQELVEDLLFLAREDGRTSKVSKELVDLDVIVDSEVAAIRAETGVAVDISGVAATVALGHERHLQRLVRNVLTNASRHAQSRIRVELLDQDPIVLRVHDDGPGVPAVERDRIFDRFTRLDGARTSDGRTGLGLAIATEIVRLHDGAIGVGDSPDGGATFEVTLPAP